MALKVCTVVCNHLPRLPGRLEVGCKQLRTIYQLYSQKDTKARERRGKGAGKARGRRGKAREGAGIGTPVSYLSLGGQHNC